MIVEEFDIEKKFVDYNELYFECELPFPNIKIIHSYKNLGICTCKFDDYDNITEVTIGISDNYDFTEEQFDDVLLHEMIHYYLAWTKQDVRLTHKNEFKSMMKLFNELYGTNISIKTNVTNFKLNKNKKSFLSKLLALF